MTARGAKIARAFGERLPAFASKREARTALLRQRDEAIAHLQTLTSGVLALDATPDSLGPLEAWYLDLHRRRAFARANTTRREVERGMSFYVGAVAKRSAPRATWIIEAFPFVPGRYEIGIRSGHLTLAIANVCDGWHAAAGVRGGALKRKYAEWFSPPPKPSRAAEKAVSDEDIRDDIAAQLSRKSTPVLGWGALLTEVRHRLGDPRLLQRRFRAVLGAMLVEGRLEEVPDARKGYERYRLVAR